MRINESVREGYRTEDGTLAKPWRGREKRGAQAPDRRPSDHPTAALACGYATDKLVTSTGGRRRQRGPLLRPSATGQCVRSCARAAPCASSGMPKPAARDQDLPGACAARACLARELDGVRSGRAVARPMLSDYAQAQVGHAGALDHPNVLEPGGEASRMSRSTPESRKKSLYRLGRSPLNSHRCSASPPSPGGRPTPSFGPATKPSSESDRSTTTFPTTFLLALLPPSRGAPEARAGVVRRGVRTTPGGGHSSPGSTPHGSPGRYPRPARPSPRPPLPPGP